MASKPASRWWGIGWLVLLVGFLCEEIPAAATEKDGTRTLSKFTRRIFNGWVWWSFLATWMVLLALHFSPLCWPWEPIAAGGFVIGARVGWCAVKDWKASA